MAETIGTALLIVWAIGAAALGVAAVSLIGMLVFEIFKDRK